MPVGFMGQMTRHAEALLEGVGQPGQGFGQRGPQSAPGDEVVPGRRVRTGERGARERREHAIVLPFGSHIDNPCVQGAPRHGTKGRITLEPYSNLHL